MELRHLRYFIAVADAGSFTRASIGLGIQQPPLSQQIKALEVELGFTLFERNPKGVTLSVGGSVFLTEARRLIDGLARATALAEGAASGTTGRLAIAFTTSSITHRITPRLIRAFRDAHPGVSIAIHEGSAAKLVDSLLDGSVDIGLLRTPVARPPDMRFIALAHDPLLLVIPRAHGLAKKVHRPKKSAIGTLPLRALKDEPFILVRRPGGMGIYSDLLNACQTLGFTPTIATEVENMLTNIALVAAGLGVSAVPGSMQFVHREDVIYLRPRERLNIDVPLTVAHMASNPNPVTRRFVAFAESFVPADVNGP
jgi:DNA-binding transcriptional LysR family regulator